MPLRIRRLLWVSVIGSVKTIHEKMIVSLSNFSNLVVAEKACNPFMISSMSSCQRVEAGQSLLLILKHIPAYIKSARRRCGL